MSLMAAAALTGAAGSVSIARNDDSYSAALGATDSGVDDVLYRLNAQEDTSFELAQNIWCYDQTAFGRPSRLSARNLQPGAPARRSGVGDNSR